MMRIYICGWTTPWKVVRTRVPSHLVRCFDLCHFGENVEFFLATHSPGWVYSSASVRCVSICVSITLTALHSLHGRALRNTSAVTLSATWMAVDCPESSKQQAINASCEGWGLIEMMVSYDLSSNSWTMQAGDRHICAKKNLNADWKRINTFLFIAY